LGGGGGFGGGGSWSHTVGGSFGGPSAPASLMTSRPPKLVVTVTSRKYGVSDW
jgi:hypothetical protein